MSTTPHIARNAEDDVAILSPVGEFDIASTDLLRTTMLDAISASMNKIVLDLSETTFLDSMALGVILGAAKRAAGWGGWLRLVAPPPNIRKVLRMTAVDTVLGLYDSVDQAVRHVPTQQLTAHMRTNPEPAES